MPRVCFFVALIPPVLGLIFACVMATPPDVEAALPATSESVATRPVEDRLSGGASTLMRGLIVTVRRASRAVMASLERWQDWTPGILAFGLALPLAAAFDPALFAAWRGRGMRGARGLLMLSVAVFLRLILDSRTPASAKALLLFCVIYGISSRDLLPDANWAIGFVDDAAVIAVGSRVFIGLCPNQLVFEHASKATRRRAWSLRRKPPVSPLKLEG